MRVYGWWCWQQIFSHAGVTDCHKALIFASWPSQLSSTSFPHDWSSILCTMSPSPPPPSPPPPAADLQISSSSSLSEAILGASVGVPLRILVSGTHYLNALHLSSPAASPSSLSLSASGSESALLVAQGPTSQLFALTAATLRVTLRGLQLNGTIHFNTSGGVLQMINCTFQPSAYAGGRAALQLSAGTADLRSVMFLALAAGALLVDGGHVTIHSCHLAHNQAERGAAARVSAGILNMLQTVIEYNTASQEGGALAVDGGAVLLGNQTILRGNTAPVAALASVATGSSLHYGLPAPFSHWIVAPFHCTEYRVPCGQGESGCNPGTMPLLADQPCNWQVNPVALGMTMASFSVGLHDDPSYPLACPAATYGNSLDVAAQSRPTCSGGLVHTARVPPWCRPYARLGLTAHLVAQRRLGVQRGRIPTPRGCRAQARASSAPLDRRAQQARLSTCFARLARLEPCLARSRASCALLVSSRRTRVTRCVAAAHAASCALRARVRRSRARAARTPIKTC
jgi:hypothetical protein